MQQVHLLISGSVQGVGYRQFVKSSAGKLGLTGWVRNLPDGRVEAVAQGEKQTINELLKRCRKGPFLAEVETIEVREEKEAKMITGFTILPAPS